MTGTKEWEESPRRPTYDVDELFVKRWSGRSMTGESLNDEELMPLFEAARWAPSSRNNQPWRYLFVRRGNDNWGSFFGLLSDKNKRWADKAAVLVLVVSRLTYEGRDSEIRNASFSTGASWENLALEGTKRGLVVHPMAGFDHHAARDVLDVPPEYKVEIMIAIGVRGPRDDLPADLREREYPKGRKPLDEILFEDSFE